MSGSKEHTAETNLGKKKAFIIGISHYSDLRLLSSYDNSQRREIPDCQREDKILTQ
jgi:hypothetical protein